MKKKQYAVHNGGKRGIVIVRQKKYIFYIKENKWKQRKTIIHAKIYSLIQTNLQKS